MYKARKRNETSFDNQEFLLPTGIRKSLSSYRGCREMAAEFASAKTSVEAGEDFDVAKLPYHRLTYTYL